MESYLFYNRKKKLLISVFNIMLRVKVCIMNHLFVTYLHIFLGYIFSSIKLVNDS